MKDRRTAPRKRVLKSASIVLSDKAPKLDCTVKNISETGAMLQVSTTLGIPASFDIVLEGARRHCHSVWRTDTRIGVTFQRVFSDGSGHGSSLERPTQTIHRAIIVTRCVCARISLC